MTPVMQTSIEKNGGAVRPRLVRLVHAGGWWVAEAQTKTRAVEIGAPGLWKEAGGEGAMVFSVPGSAMTRDFDAREDGLMKWVRSTARGRVPAGWEAPSAEALDEWLPMNSRSIRHDVVIRQLEVLSSPACLSVRMPLVTMPDDLPEERSAWLGNLLLGASASWRFVRLGFSESSAGSLVAEINLTGAPEPVLPGLVRSARDTLHWLAAAVLATAEFLVRTNTESDALKIFPPESVRAGQPKP